MSKAAKPARSGLGTVTRDFGTQEMSQGSKASQEILWPSSSPPQRQPIRTLNPKEARMKAIEEALAQHKASTAVVSKPVAPLRESSSNTQSSGSSDASLQKMARKRAFPASFHDVASSASLSAPSKKPRSTASSNGHQSAFKVNLPTSNSSANGSNIAEPFMSPEQNHILDLAVSQGMSLFYTGSAGTGKSVLLRKIIKGLRQKKKRIAITAPTGIAACNIGGTTIHSFAGVGLGQGPFELLMKKVQKNKKTKDRWRTTDVLIIDEISMVDGDLFDTISKIGGEVRLKPALPFGGMQIIVTGDFFQLPPVTKTGVVKYAFEAQAWKEAIKHTFNLTKVFRQSDQTFVDMLNEMRLGSLSTNSIRRFRSLQREVVYDDGVGATELYPRRSDVENSNRGRLEQLATQHRKYRSIDIPPPPPTHPPPGAKADFAATKFYENLLALPILELRVDAQVMLIKNHDETLVNGSLGRVIRFVDPAVFGTEYDAEGTPGEGVIGAATTMSGVGSAARKPPNSASVAPGQLYPVVEFVSARGPKRRMLIMPEVWKEESADGRTVLYTRTQLPLILSWAMSIHKAQGQTLERVKVDLGKAFEMGQAYVALSRATSLDGLQVLNFNPAKVMAHPKVIEWSKSLTSVGLPTK